MQLQRRVSPDSDTLNLNFCKLTEFQTSSVCRLLVSPTNIHLNRLTLSGNVLDDTAVKMLVETLNKAKHIHHLDLSENPISAPLGIP
eukprot:1188983-Prorocentrum_minimum.AAC.1